MYIYIYIYVYIYIYTHSIPKAIHRTTETHTLCNPILRICSGSDICNLKKVYIQEALPRSAGPGRFGSLGNAPWGIAVWGILRSKLGWGECWGLQVGVWKVQRLMRRSKRQQGGVSMDQSAQGWSREPILVPTWAQYGPNLDWKIA